VSTAASDRHLARARIGRHTHLPRRAAVIVAGLALCGTSVVAAAGSASAQSEPSGNVNVVGYSVVGPAYQALETDFQHTAAGASVTFTNTFGSSGTESKAVAAGLPADIVNFATGADMTRLVPKYVASNWNSGPDKGFVTDSIVAFGVPKGNPDHITSWTDLLKKNVRIFTPNPYSSGSAQWNIMAMFGYAKDQHGNLTSQTNFVRQVLAKSVTQAANAATEIQDFLTDSASNKNDVLLDYEDDIFQAQQAGDPISLVVPPQSILIQNPIAVTTDSKNPTAANAFLSYLLSTAGQKIWGSLGYRPVERSVIKNLRVTFPVPKKGTFDINWFGGWGNVENTYFGVPNGIVTKVESSLDQST
jgi:sulfate/thiosulfate transport system substrate-binding protein